MSEVQGSDSLIPQELSEKEMAKIMLVRYRNEMTERKVHERYMQRKALLEPKMKPLLGDIQGKIRAGADMIKFLEEVVAE